MAWVAVDYENNEFIYDYHPIDLRYKRNGVFHQTWFPDEESVEIKLPKGSIEKLIGRKLTWEDEPVEL